jgi:cell wall-associated NlpC family hydrolase
MSAIDPRPYLGVPYRDRGRDWDGWDCWGLVRAVFWREAGLELPAWDTDPRDRAAVEVGMAAEARGWRRVERGTDDRPWTDARPLDVALLMDAGRPSHCAVFLKPPLFRHCQRGPGTSVGDVAHPLQPWRRRLVAVYRHPALA